MHCLDSSVLNVFFMFLRCCDDISVSVLLEPLYSDPRMSSQTGRSTVAGGHSDVDRVHADHLESDHLRLQQQAVYRGTQQTNT